MSLGTIKANMQEHGVEIEIEVPCAEGQSHPVRLRITGWGEYEVVYNPCDELLGTIFARMARCNHYLSEEFPAQFRQDITIMQQLIEVGRAVGEPAVLIIIQALGDDYSSVRVAACRALGEIGDRQAVPPLIQALRDRDVRAAACEALGAIGDPPSPQPSPPLARGEREKGVGGF